jgi:hypothetical protein
MLNGLPRKTGFAAKEYLNDFSNAFFGFNDFLN